MGCFIYVAVYYLLIGIVIVNLMLMIEPAECMTRTQFVVFVIFWPVYAFYILFIVLIITCKILLDIMHFDEVIEHVKPLIQRAIDFFMIMRHWKIKK